MLKTGLTCIYEQRNDFLFEYLSNGSPNCVKVAREHFFRFDKLRSFVSIWFSVQFVTRKQRRIFVF